MSGTYILFSHSNLNQLRNHLLSKMLLLASPFNGLYYYIPKCLLKTSCIICDVYDISVCKTQYPSVDNYWYVRRRKYFICAQLYIPFNFTVLPLIYCFLSKILYSYHILVGYTNISSVRGWFFNKFNSTSVQFTLFILTWHDFT